MKFIVTLLELSYLWFMRCLNCRKDVEQTEGKRRKLYCSPKCRVAYCRKKKPPKKSGRKPGRPKKIQEYAKKLAQEVFNAPSHEPRDLSKIQGIASPELINEAILAEIKSLEAEKAPPHIQSEQMRVLWQQGQRKKINDLRNKLKNQQ